MQLIAEAYDILKRGLGLHESEIADIFTKWNKGVLDSFLIEITANILKFNDDDGEPLVTKILDKAGQKGTGKWTAIAALDAGTAGKSHLSSDEIANPDQAFCGVFNEILQSP
jgi:6-phosphogluconate dehydrogenase